MSVRELFRDENPVRFRVFEAGGLANQHLRDIQNVEDQEDDENEDQEDEEEEEEEEEEEFSDEELEMDCLPDLDDVDGNGNPLVVPSSPLALECPDYPTNDPRSALRRYFQDIAGVSSQRLLETVVGRLMELPEFRYRTRSESALHSYLFGLQSLEWRSRVFSTEENERYSQHIVASNVGAADDDHDLLILGPNLKPFEQAKQLVNAIVARIRELESCQQN